MRGLFVTMLPGLIALSACTGDPDSSDASGTGDDGTRSWTVVHEGLDGALLSVWTEGGTVYTVGADGGDGPEVWSLQDDAWGRLQTGETGDLWWVNPDADGDLWMVGEGGMALRHSPGTGDFERVDTPTDSTLWGVWFAPSGRGWSVGGTISPREGVIMTRAADAWELETLPPDVQNVVDENLLYKVWGTAEDDVWVVGEGGVVLHRDGGDWSLVDTPGTPRLFTVHGSSDGTVVMVGGAASATVLEWDGQQIVDISDQLPNTQGGLNGVFVAEDGTVHVVGAYGFLAERDPEGQWSKPDVLGTGHGLHAVRLDDSGGIWGVGGEITLLLTEGTMVHYGATAPPLPGSIVPRSPARTKML